MNQNPILSITTLIILLIVMPFAFVGCKKNDTKPEQNKEETKKEFRLELKESSIKLELGMSVRPLFVIHNFNPNLEDAPNLEWNSYNPEIASVDQIGNISAKTIGKTKISLKIKDSKTEVFFDVEVLPSSPKSLTLYIEKNEIAVGEKAQITYKIEPSSVTNITDKDIEWSSGAEKIFTVSNGKITGVSVGIAIVKAKIKGTDITANLEVRITPKIVFAEIGKQIKAPDGLSLTIKKVDVSKNTDGTQYYNIQYNLKNENKDSKIMEGGFRLYKTDGKYIEQYGFFNYLYSGEQTTRSYTFKALSSESVTYLEYRPDITASFDTKLRLKIN